VLACLALAAYAHIFPELLAKEAVMVAQLCAVGLQQQAAQFVAREVIQTRQLCNTALSNKT
jgi:hypothetical protein